jgi:hypothetical protein
MYGLTPKQLTRSPLSTEHTASEQGGCGNERQCHAAQWTIDHTAKPPHGAVFQKWADAAMRAVPGMSVTTCHNYEIFKPFKFGCTKCPQVRLCCEWSSTVRATVHAKA